MHSITVVCIPCLTAYIQSLVSQIFGTTILIYTFFNFLMRMFLHMYTYVFDGHCNVIRSSNFMPGGAHAFLCNVQM